MEGNAVDRVDDALGGVETRDEIFDFEDFRGQAAISWGVECARSVRRARLSYLR
jgi:hypothetical protein